MSEPLGAIIAYIFLRNYINELLLSYILIFVAGLMISLSINDIFKEVIKYKLYRYMIIGIISSFVVFSLSIFI